MGLTIHYELFGERPGTYSFARVGVHEARRLVALLRREALKLSFERVGDLVELSGAEAVWNRPADERPQTQAEGWACHARHYVWEDYDGRHVGHPVPARHIIAFGVDVGPGSESCSFGLALYPKTVRVKRPERLIRTSRSKRRAGGPRFELRPEHYARLRTGVGGWYWGDFCKTIYAANPEHGGVRNFLRCHLSVVWLLDRAAELGFGVEVNDEGDYWSSRQPQALAEYAGEWNEAVADFARDLYAQAHPEEPLTLDVDAPVSLERPRSRVRAGAVRRRAPAN